MISRVTVADSATPRATVSAAVEVSATFLAISRVVMLCSSTAEAIVRETSLTFLITSVISPMERTAWPLDD